MNIETNSDDENNSTNNSQDIDGYNINLSEGEDEFVPMIDLMNIFSVYYNKKNKTNGNLFSGTNPFNKHSINNRMIEFMEEIKTYNLMSKSYISKNIDKFESCHNLFQLEIKNGETLCTINEDEEYDNGNTTYFSNNIIALMIKLSEMEWINLNWNISKVD